MDFKEIAETQVLIFDGAIGTMLMDAGMDSGDSPEEFMLKNPAALERVHGEYVAAGAQILTTNTFGASPLRLSQFGLEDETEKICRTAVEIARKASRGEAYIAGSIGPLGEYLRPFGELEPARAFESFRRQASALAAADLIIIETMSDLLEAQIALRAARAATDLPVIVQFSFDDDGRTVTGSGGDVAAVTFGAMGAFGVGTNCGSDPKTLIPAVEDMAIYFPGPISAEPNAGVPEMVGGKPVWPASPGDMAELALEFLNAGANLIGSCCGSTPEHTAAIAGALREAGPVEREIRPGLHLAGRSSVVSIGSGNPLRLVGERINPAGRKLLKKELSEGKTGRLRREASRQKAEGAEILDLNVSVPGADEAELMAAGVRAASAAADLPLFVDSTSGEAVRAGLEYLAGRPVINSISASWKDMEAKLPLAAEFGAALVALPLSEDGIPDDPKKRVRLVKKIASAAKEYGIGRDSVLADPIVLAASANPEAARITLKTARLLKEEGFLTVCGLSNISHGLPNRAALNGAFLAELAPYLDAVIANPGEEGLMDILVTSRFLGGGDPRGEGYIARFSGAPETPTETDEEPTLRSEIITGNPEKASELAKIGLKLRAPLELINEIVIPALREVGERFDRKEIFLPGVIGSAAAAKAALAVARENLGDEQISNKGKILLATVEGDIHDIGKNLVGALLSAHGYEVIDLGKSVPSSKIVAAINDENPDGVGLSALMTTTMPAMESAVADIKKNCPALPVVVGGACVDTDFAKRIGADGYARDAVSAVKMFDELISGRN